MKKDYKQEDHDLLIELRTNIDNIRKDIKDLKDNITTRVEALEREKADRVDLEVLQRKINDDIEIRMRCLEESKAVLAGKASQNSVIIAYLLSLAGIVISLIKAFQ